MSWKIVFTNQAQKDARKAAVPGFKPQIEKLLQIMEDDPFQTSPPFEKLVGDFRGTYSRRINIQHRLAYQIFKDQKIIKIIRMWTHYE